MHKSRRVALMHKFYQATKEFVVIALYLWLIFGLFALYRSVILAEDHVSAAEEGFALINALVLGKIVLAAQKLRLGDFVNEAPLIYPTLVKSGLFSVVLAVFKILEEVVTGVVRGRSFQQGVPRFGGGTWQGILCLTLLLSVLLIPFFGFTELQRVLGKKKLRGLFFRPRPAGGEATVGGM